MADHDAGSSKDLAREFRQIRERKCTMNKFKFVIFTSLAFVPIALTWGIDRGWAQQAPIPTPHDQHKIANSQKFQEEMAAKRAAQGQMRSTTPSQRKTAAESMKGTLETQQQAPISTQMRSTTPSQGKAAAEPTKSTVETQQQQNSQSQTQQAPVSTKQYQQKMTNYQSLREELAAKRAAQGQMRSTTPSQRKAAAKRLKATFEAQQEQSAPSSGTEVNER